MTAGPRIAIGTTGAALPASGAAPWTMFGSMICFVLPAAGFIGCFQ